MTALLIGLAILLLILAGGCAMHGLGGPGGERQPTTGTGTRTAAAERPTSDGSVPSASPQTSPSAEGTATAAEGGTPGAGLPSPTAVRPAGEKTVVTLLVPLGAAGTTGHIARSLKQAAELALVERNVAHVELDVRDSGETPDTARAAAEAGLARGARLLLGPLFSSSVQAVAPLARAAGVPVIAFSNDARVAGDGVYLLSFMPEHDARRIVSFAVAADRRRFAALIPDDAYGQLLEAAFREAVTANGATLVAATRYPPNANGMLEKAQSLIEMIKGAEDAGSPVDTLFVPGGPDILPTLGPMIGYAGLDTTKIRIVGSAGWDYPNIGRELAFVGGWFPAPDPDGWRDFAERFARAHIAPPPRIATLAYDAMGIALQLAGERSPQSFTRAGIERRAGFVGVDGPVRFGSDGRPERALAVIEVRRGATAVLERAPAGFDAAPAVLPGVDARPPPPATGLPRADLPPGAAAPQGTPTKVN